MNPLDDNELFKAARFYASLGMPVFPLKAGLKNPATLHGVNDATTDLPQIETWWQNAPNNNVAIACGNGLYVIDVDVSKYARTNGFDSLKEFGQLPDTVSQTTPRGGVHYLYGSDYGVHGFTPPAGKIGFRPGIDIKSTGGYIVAAPSVCTDGEGSGGCYRWLDGKSPGQISLAGFPEGFRHSSASTAAPPAVPSVWPVSTPTEPANELLMDRAKSYLEEIEGAVQGFQGHAKLFWACQCMVNGLRLSDADALQLLWGFYNPKCSPPWDYTDDAERRDFERKVTEARKNPPRDYAVGWLIEEEIDPAVLPDLNLLLASHLAKEVEVATVLNPGELEFLCHPPGLLGGLCAWINSTAMREQPFLTLGCSLTFLGAIMGRKVRDSNGSRTNLYCMSVADSSAGKNNAPYQIRRLCEVAGVNDMLGGNDIASDASIESRMAKHTSTFFLLDEIGFLLTHIKSGRSNHQAQIIKVLMDLYSSAGSTFKGREYADEDNQRTIVQPCCCLFGTSTPDRFQTGISSEELTDGWLSRCLVFFSDSFPDKDYDRPEVTVPQHLAESVAMWWDRNTVPQKDGNSLTPFQAPDGVVPVPIVVPTDRNAEMSFRRFNKNCESKGRASRDVGPLWFKAEENARRIALIVAAGSSFHDPVITDAISDYATRLVDYLVTSFISTFVPNMADSEIEYVKNNLLKLIDNAGPAGCRKRDFSRSRAMRKINSRLRQDCLQDLIDSGEVITETFGAKGGANHWTEKTYAEREK